MIFNGVLETFKDKLTVRDVKEYISKFLGAQPIVMDFP